MKTTEKTVPMVQPAKQETRAFERLHALVRKGYVPDLGQETPSGGIVLRHLGMAPDLLLHPDGVVDEHDGRVPWHKRKVRGPGNIEAREDADQVRFLKFIETVPKPSLRDRTRPWRKKYIYVPIVLLIVWGMSLAFTAMIANT
ncbi:MAG: hypothetical protein H0W74_09260 [Sphingosinicella sp.]|nr:hypothetical protein [Sphingosinicella sp.]